MGFAASKTLSLAMANAGCELHLPGPRPRFFWRAVGDQADAIGCQSGGRVWLFLETEDFEADHQRLEAAGAVFESPPRHEPYGRVAVWRDPWGKRWDLIEYANPDRSGT
ncbi:MAG: VOC family protein [Paracoccaceae bacterium]|nr:VOC family protein [Paracoccaceae bacterium]